MSSLAFSTGMRGPCTIKVNRVKALLKVSLALNILAASSSLVFVGTRAARSRSRMATTPLLRVTSPWRLVFRAAEVGGDTAAPAASSSLCVSTSSGCVCFDFFLPNEGISSAESNDIIYTTCIIIIINIMSITDIIYPKIS